MSEGRHLPPFRLECYFSKWEFEARYHMAASDAQSMTLSELLALGEPQDREAFDRLWLGYTQTWGEPNLRESIAGTYSGMTSNNILCFAGSEEGIYVAMHAILDELDHAVVVTPNYQSLEAIPGALCSATGWPLDPAHGWAADLTRLRSSIRHNTKLIAINFPHNPTGKIIDRDTFDELIHICRARGIWLLSDEVYRLMERDPALRLPQVADVYERGISVNGLSKVYGLPGLRIGWVACADKTALERMEQIKHYLSICNSGPSEHLARIAIRAREQILGRNRELAARNCRLLEDFFAEFPDLFEWHRPDGGVVGFPRYLASDGVEAFTSRLLRQTGVLLLPGTIYHSSLGPVPLDRFRIGFGRSITATGLEVMRSHLRQTNLSQ